LVADKDWYTVAEVAVLLDLVEPTVRKRVQRLVATDANTDLVRRTDPVDEGGRARFEVHRTQVDKWRPVTAQPAQPAEPVGRHDPERPEADVLSEHLEYARDTARAYEIELHQAELAHRDALIAALQEKNVELEQRLAEKDFELAEKRTQLATLGQTIADLYK